MVYSYCMSANEVICMGSLSGRCVLITRARAQAADLVRLIHERGGTTYEFPVITIADPESWEPLDRAIANIGQYRWLVITSPNGAEKFLGRLAANRVDVTTLNHLRVVAVGKATAKTLAAGGLRVDVIPHEARGAALPDAMGPMLVPGDRVLMARANLGDPAHAAGLRELGAEVEDLVAYRTLLEGGDVTALKEALRQGQIHYVTLTSSSTVNNLLERLGGKELLDGVRVAVMGPETKKAAEAAGLTVHVMASKVSVEDLVKAIEDDCGDR